MNLLSKPLFWIGYIWIFWYIYILVMGLYRARLAGRLTGTQYYLALPAVFIGYIIDIFANLTIANVIFLDPPKEILVTERLKRYKKLDQITWRYKLANWICENLLDPFDPNGDHC